MDKFSLYNYAQLSDTFKADFNKTLAQGFATISDEMKSDDDLNYSLLEEFIVSLGQCSNSSKVVEDLYSKISTGIQVGSGNQSLFLGVLAKYTAAWETTNSK